MGENYPSYNLKVVINETGLTPATIRAWERRYEVLKPKRSTGGHRLYSEEEINLLKWLVARKKEGMSISRAVELWRNQAFEPPVQTEEASIMKATIPINGGTLDEFRRTWVEACLAFNEIEAELVTSKALAVAAPEAVCTEVLQKGLAEMGEGWYAGAINVQQEHFASALVSRHLNALFSVAPMPTRPERLLAVCPPGETHDLALLMLAFMLRWRGWEVIYLGADIPLDRLDETLQATSPKLVISVAQTLPGAASLFELAEFTNARSIPMAYGGGIFNHIPDLVKRIPGHFLGWQLDSASQVVEQLLSFRLPQPIIPPVPPSAITLQEILKDKEDLVFSRVRQIMHSSPINPQYIEIANIHFHRSITASLILGEINYLDYSVTWLNGLLKNRGLPLSYTTQYYQAVLHAFREVIGNQARSIMEWISKVENIT